jgi:hypothetical protein
MAELLLTRKPTLIQRFDVGEATTVAVSRMRMPGAGASGERLAGSVSRGTCARAKGTKDCARHGCQAPPNHRNEAKDCANHNMRAVFDELALEPKQMLVVGTRSDRVGYYDQCYPSVRAGGFRETDRDYAAFFARHSDGVAVATHMADCGFVAVEFPGVFGFMHLTRLNMSLPAARHFLHHALGHYGARLEDVRLRLISGISGPNFPQHFAGEPGSRPDDRFPGWFAKGLLRNKTRPLWLPSDPIDPSDVWETDNREVMRRMLLDTGVDESQLVMQDVIDPGDLDLGHASHSWGMRGHIEVGRDAYVIAPTAIASARAASSASLWAMPSRLS